MAVHKWTSIKQVLDRLATIHNADLWSEVDAYEWCANAMDSIGVVVQYEPDIFFTTVSNHKSCLPKGLIQLRQMAFIEEFELTAYEREEIERYIGIDDETNLSSNIINKLVSNSSTRWKALPVSTNTFALQVIDPEFQILTDRDGNYLNEDNWFTLKPSGEIITSFKDGYLAMSYLRYPLNDDGDFLIPNDEDYLEALYSYCMMRLWEIRMNMKEEGAYNLFKEYAARWSLFKAKAIASVNSPDLSQIENLRRINSTLIPRQRRFQGFFGALGTEQWHRGQGFSATDPQ